MFDPERLGVNCKLNLIYQLLMLNLEHHWIQNADKVSNVCLGEGVRLKIKQFTLMNKFKKKVLRVSTNS